MIQRVATAELDWCTRLCIRNPVLSPWAQVHITINAGRRKRRELRWKGYRNKSRWQKLSFTDRQWSIDRYIQHPVSCLQCLMLLLTLVQQLQSTVCNLCNVLNPFSQALLSSPHRWELSWAFLLFSFLLALSNFLSLFSSLSRFAWSDPFVETFPFDWRFDSLFFCFHVVHVVHVVLQFQSWPLRNDIDAFVSLLPSLAYDR